jgi:membrane associated rhomboid family serine protease
MKDIGFSVDVLLIASVVAVSIAAWAVKELRNRFILSPVRVVQKKEIYRLLTAGWIHADTTHLLFNMLTLWFFAGRVLAVLGPVKFLALYVTSVFVGFIPTTLRFMKKASYSSLGASGAVAAVMFSAILLVPNIKISIAFLPIALPGFVYAILYLAYSAWHSYRGRDGINHDAHFTGAIYGAVVTYIFEPVRAANTLRHLF